MDGGPESSADRPDPDPGPDGSDGSDGNVAFANDPNDPKDAGWATAAAAARSFAASGIRETHAATGVGAGCRPQTRRSARAHDDANATDPDRSNEFFFRGSESVFSFDAAIDGDAKDDADAENSDADAENSDADADPRVNAATTSSNVTPPVGASSPSNAPAAATTPRRRAADAQNATRADETGPRSDANASFAYAPAGSVAAGRLSSPPR